MATQTRVPGAASSEVDFELERFERTSEDRIEISGRWYGLRGRRFVRPVLNLPTVGGSRRRAIALLEHKPWAADDGQTWLAAFAWPQGAGDVEGAELEVGPGLIVDLPAPGGKPGSTGRVSALRPHAPAPMARRIVEEGAGDAAGGEAAGRAARSGIAGGSAAGVAAFGVGLVLIRPPRHRCGCVGPQCADTPLGARLPARCGQVDDQPGADLQLGALDVARALRPGERGDPGLPVVRRPGLVLQQRDRAPAGAAGRAQVEHGAHEAATAQAVPAAGDLDPVLVRPLEALELEVDLG